jgi:hypothetical protein
MEVHHHPIAIGSHTSRNKWTHYFWEFLMLFLAVFCGFLAENQREHYIEKIRAKQYARSLISDLKKDTAMINAIIRQLKNSITRADSLAVLLTNKPIDQIRNIDLFTLSTELYRHYTWSRATLEQIKNSGSLRYFSNDSIIARISSYDAFTRHMDEDYKGDEARAHRAVEKRNQIVDHNYPRQFIISLLANRDSLMKTDYFNEMAKNGPRLLTSNINDVKIFLNEKLSIRQHFSTRGESELPELIKDAEELILLLKKEFHLK